MLVLLHDTGNGEAKGAGQRAPVGDADRELVTTRRADEGGADDDEGTRSDRVDGPQA
jgi:hypothetical protein